jgi:hypothetical protein
LHALQGSMHSPGYASALVPPCTPRHALPNQTHTAPRVAPMPASTHDTCNWPASGIAPGRGFMTPRGFSTSAVVPVALAPNIIRPRTASNLMH